MRRCPAACRATSVLGGAPLTDAAGSRGIRAHVTAHRGALAAVAVTHRTADLQPRHSALLIAPEGRGAGSHGLFQHPDPPSEDRPVEDDGDKVLSRGVIDDDEGLSTGHAETAVHGAEAGDSLEVGPGGGDAVEEGVGLNVVGQATISLNVEEAKVRRPHVGVLACGAAESGPVLDPAGLQRGVSTESAVECSDSGFTSVEGVVELDCQALSQVVRAVPYEPGHLGLVGIREVTEELLGFLAGRSGGPLLNQTGDDVGGADFLACTDVTVDPRCEVALREGAVVAAAAAR